MSQPKNFGPNELDPFFKPLKNLDQLVKIFHDVERPKEEWMIGIEYEMFGQISQGVKPIPYEGPVSITNFFFHLASVSKHRDDPFIPIIEDNHIVGLNCRRAVIALEPGGQLEIAAKPHRKLSDVTSVFSAVVQEIEISASELGINLFALGIHPMATREDMAQVKKARYGIMRDYMHGLDGLGLDMMTRSCAIQLNLDFKDQQDMVQKTRLGAALVPIYSLLCASSAFVDKKPSSHVIQRGHVWRKTDPARTGIPAIVFAKDFSYATWVNMVLDVPMYFIRRGPTYHNVAGASFREFMATGLIGHQATVRDFLDHMSTVFTEIRLKPILELRSADSLPVPYVNALSALTWALFYHDQAHSRALKLFGDVSHQEIVALQNDAIDYGRQAQFRGREIFSLCEELLAVAQDALNNLAINSLSPDLAGLLEPLNNLVKKNTTCAEWIKTNFRELDEKNFTALMKKFAPFNNPLA